MWTQERSDFGQELLVMSITIGMMILFGIKMTNKTSKLGTTNRRENNTVFSVQFKAQIFLSMNLLMLQIQRDWCQDPCLIFVLKTPRIMRETTTKYLMGTIVETVKWTASPKSHWEFYHHYGQGKESSCFWDWSSQIAPDEKARLSWLPGIQKSSCWLCHVSNWIEGSCQ